MDTHLQSLTASLWLSLAARLSFVIPYIAPGCCLVLDSSVYEGCVSSGVNMLAFWACDRRQVTCAPVRLRLVDTAMHLWAGPQGRCPPAGVVSVFVPGLRSGCVGVAGSLGWCHCAALSPLVHILPRVPPPGGWTRPAAA